MSSPCNRSVVGAPVFRKSVERPALLMKVVGKSSRVKHTVTKGDSDKGRRICLKAKTRGKGGSSVFYLKHMHISNERGELLKTNR